MPQLSIDEKIRRSSQFLVGLRNPRVSGALVPYGFTSEARREGWALMAKAGGAELDLPAAPPGGSTSGGLLKALDEMENRWFPIARATLRRHAPEALEEIFRNLRQTEGLDVILSVGTFVRRVRAASPKVQELLASRGLTDDVLALAEGLLAEVSQAPAIVDDDALEAAQAATEEAVDALWSWYLEWSAIARSVISDKRLLRVLGFGKRRSAPRGEDAEPLAPVEDAAPEAPAGAPSVS